MKSYIIKNFTVSCFVSLIGYWIPSTCSACWWELGPPGVNELTRNDTEYEIVAEWYFEPGLVHLCCLNRSGEKTCGGYYRVSRAAAILNDWVIMDGGVAYNFTKTFGGEIASRKQGSYNLKVMNRDDVKETNWEIDNTPKGLSASITGTEGLVDINGTVEFTRRRNDLWEGSIVIDRISPDGRVYRITTRKYFKNGITAWKFSEIVGMQGWCRGNGIECYWERIIDAGSMAQGEYIYKFTAIAANGAESDPVEVVLPIDNTPKVSIAGPDVCGEGANNEGDEKAMDIIGTVEFKERYYDDWDGYLILTISKVSKDGGAPVPVESYRKYYNKTADGQKEFTWRYSELNPSHKCLHSDYVTQQYTVTAEAYAYNGAYSVDTKELIIPAMGCPPN